MKFPRSSGILLHPTSLPGPYGIGDLGNAAYHFADFLVATGQRLWQILPLGPTGYGDSPYQCFAAFAGNPLLISLEKLVEEGFVAPAELESHPSFPEDQVDYGQVIEFKLPLLRRSFEVFKRQASVGDWNDFESFCQQNASWLNDHALFMAVKEAHQGAVWTRWETQIARREPRAMTYWSTRLAREMETQKYWQYQFFRQWQALKQYLHQRRVEIMGDIPIYVAHDSSDVWANPDLFYLDTNGNPTQVAGVPPDYFSATGQLWGNPLYRWDVMARSGFQWWIERFRAALSLVDRVRLDHFRGFEAYWEVPATATTAIHGRWVKGPGATLFEVLQKSLNELPIVAENLGVITPEVEAIRKQFQFPGMSVLQFAFGIDPQAPEFQPHNYPRNLVAYTGTHDNDTTIGWWTSAGIGESTRSQQNIKAERDFAKKYLATDGREINWVFIRTLLASVADTVIIPLQDVLGLGSEARMNLPATSSGNWRWRYTPEMLSQEIQERLKEMTSIYGRLDESLS